MSHPFPFFVCGKSRKWYSPHTGCSPDCSKVTCHTPLSPRDLFNSTLFFFFALNEKYCKRRLYRTAALNLLFVFVDDATSPPTRLRSILPAMDAIRSCCRRLRILQQIVNVMPKQGWQSLIIYPDHRERGETVDAALQRHRGDAYSSTRCAAHRVLPSPTRASEQGHQTHHLEEFTRAWFQTVTPEYFIQGSNHVLSSDTICGHLGDKSVNWIMRRQWATEHEVCYCILKTQLQ